MVCHYLTQNSKIRAPLFWKADILQMAIMHQLVLGQLGYSLVPCFPLLVYYCCFFSFIWMSQSLLMHELYRVQS